MRKEIFARKPEKKEDKMESDLVSILLWNGFVFGLGFVSILVYRLGEYLLWKD